MVKNKMEIKLAIRNNRKMEEKIMLTLTLITGA